MSRASRLKILKARQQKSSMPEGFPLSKRHQRERGYDVKSIAQLNNQYKGNTLQKKHNIAVICAIFDNLDNLKLMPKQTIPFDFYYFDEGSKFPLKEFSSRLKAKYFKLQSHRIPELARYDTIIWMDGSFQVKKYNFISWLTSHLKESNIAVLEHPERSCIYEEFKFMEKLIKDGSSYMKSRYSIDALQNQIDEYKKEKYPSRNGLYSCGLFIRKQDSQTNKLFDDWWAENCKWSIQDQLSFPYVLWKNNMKANKIEIDIFKNSYFSLINHLK